MAHAHRVFSATFPKRSGDRHVLIRVLKETSAYLIIRITAMPGDPVFTRKRVWHVSRADLDTMIATRLARSINTLRCPSCHNSMSLYDAKKHRKSIVVFACSACEECVEV